MEDEPDSFTFHADRVWIIGVTAAALALSVWLGALVGSGELAIPIAVFVGLLLVALKTVTARHVRTEVLVLSFLTFGYIVGNRGFAGIKLVPGLPLYFGEIGMLTCVALYAMRNAFLKQNPVSPGVLSHAIVVFLLIGVARFLVDFRTYGEFAARDFAAVYYAAFFFLGFSASQHIDSRRCYEKILFVSMTLLIPIYLIDLFFPDLFTHITLQGLPVILQKGDLQAIFLGWASFYCFLQDETGKHRRILAILSMVSLALMIHSGCRAAYVAAFFGCFLMFVARQYAWLTIQAAAALAVLLIVFSVVGFNRNYGLYEAVKQSHGMEDTSTQNNQFRLVWWREIFEETQSQAPWFGLGFGYDLAAGFLRLSAAQIDPEAFDVRSPHNYFVTIYGRMGAVGECVWVVIVFSICQNALASAWDVRRGRQGIAALALWAGVTMLLVSAAFGVVLEGPMGAIPFWCALGMAMERKSRAQEKLPASEPFISLLNESPEPHGLPV